MVVHLVLDARQPEVCILCNQEWQRSKADTSLPGIYVSEGAKEEDDKTYTFSLSKVTCQACKETYTSLKSAR